MRTSLFFLLTTTLVLFGFLMVGHIQLFSLSKRFANASATERLVILEIVVERAGIEQGWRLLTENGIRPVGNLPYFMGKKIFELHGMAGASMCHERFLKGCRSAFIESILTQKGLGSIPELKDICRRWGDVSWCAHGFGHSFIHLAHFNANDALSLCDTKTPEGYEHKWSCQIGVFQEDEKRYIASGATLPPDVWSRCAHVPEQYKSACGYGRAAKQFEIARPSLEDASRLCLSSDTPTIRHGCVLFLSHHLLALLKSQSLVNAKCKELFWGEEEENYCLMGVIENTASSATGTNLPVELCESISPQFYEQCLMLIKKPIYQGKSMHAVDGVFL